VLSIRSRARAQGYESYVVETTGGTLDGVRGAQTPTTIVLRHEQGNEKQIDTSKWRTCWSF